MDDERQVVLIGQSDLGGECMALYVAGGVVVVVVETGLADGHHSGSIDQIGDRVDPVACLMGVHTHSGPDIAVVRSCVDRGK